MSNRPARFTTADIRRAMRAAKAEGFDRVELVDSAEGLKIVCERTARNQPQPANEEHLDI
jgi:hypothetical protein